MSDDIIRIRLEFDKNVHPEVHEHLLAITSPKKRADRVRILTERSVLMDLGFVSAVAKSKEAPKTVQEPSPSVTNQTGRPAIKIKRDFASKKEE